MKVFFLSYSPLLFCLFILFFAISRSACFLLRIRTPFCRICELHDLISLVGSGVELPPTVTCFFLSHSEPLTEEKEGKKREWGEMELAMVVFCILHFHIQAAHTTRKNKKCLLNCVLGINMPFYFFSLVAFEMKTAQTAQICLLHIKIII